MSNTEAAPAELACRAGGSGEHEVEVLPARDVPLGGPRAMKVRRTLPQRKRSLISAWCFADHYGPEDVSVRGAMDVPPHPHTGLQTVTWLRATLRRSRRCDGARISRQSCRGDCSGADFQPAGSPHR